MDLKKKLAFTACLSCISVSMVLAVAPTNLSGNVKITKDTVDETTATGYESKEFLKFYKDVTKEGKIIEALEIMKNTLGSFSRDAVLGSNPTAQRIGISFRDLSTINPMYANYEALGWKKSKKLYIYINQKHSDAPAEALAALISHEALHQDELNSLNEETYAWTMEASVWTQLVERNPELAKSRHPLVVRENTLRDLFIKGNYSDKYIRKTVFSNPGYQNLPIRSPGFEDENL